MPPRGPDDRFSHPSDGREPRCLNLRRNWRAVLAQRHHQVSARVCPSTVDSPSYRNDRDGEPYPARRLTIGLRVVPSAATISTTVVHFPPGAVRKVIVTRRGRSPGGIRSTSATRPRRWVRTARAWRAPGARGAVAGGRGGQTGQSEDGGGDHDGMRYLPFRPVAPDAAGLGGNLGARPAAEDQPFLVPNFLGIKQPGQFAAAAYAGLAAGFAQSFVDRRFRPAKPRRDRVSRCARRSADAGFPFPFGRRASVPARLSRAVIAPADHSGSVASIPNFLSRRALSGSGRAELDHPPARLRNAPP